MTAQIAIYGRLARDPRQHETTADTLWLQVVGFGRVADDLARHPKGDPVSVAGRLQLSRYATREAWQCIADSIVSARTVRPKGGGQRRGAGTSSSTGTSRSGSRNPPAPRDTDPPPHTDADLAFDDDLPF